MKGPTGDFNLTLSDLKLNLAPDIVELVQSLQSSVLEPLVQPAPDRCVTALLHACLSCLFARECWAGLIPPSSGESIHMGLLRSFGRQFMAWLEATSSGACIYMRALGQQLGY